MPQTSGIYMITNTVTDVCYVGSAIDLLKRKREHFNALKRGNHHSAYLQRSYNTHGLDAFTWDVIEYVDPIKDLLMERETYWIQTIQPQYNSSTVHATRLGAKLTLEQLERHSERMRSQEIRDKISETLKEHDVPPEVRAKISASLMNREVSDEVKATLLRNSMNRTTEERRATSTGKRRTAETRKRMSDRAKERPSPTEETREKMAAAKRDRKLSEETKQKMSQSRMGRTFTEEQRQRISESNKATRANWTEEQRKKAPRSRKPISEETRQKMRDAKVNKKLTPEHIAHRTESQRGIKPSEETRAKMSVSNKASVQRRKDEGIQPRLHTEESRVRMSQIHKERWAKKKAQQAETLSIQQLKLFE